ncbi:MAG: 50S ribosomal protein L11 methyltransferase [Bacteroidota bacterium]
MDYIELNIKVSPRKPWTEIIIADLAENGFESFVETDEGLLAYGSESDVDFASPMVNTMLGDVHDGFEAEIVTTIIPKQNWNEQWESDFQPVFVDEYCTILAPFHTSIDVVGMPIIIQPQMSFGTGHHQTTYMMTKSLFELESMPENVLDMGTGTGVLAFVAEKLGAQKVVAVDIEDWSVENTKENALRNSCTKIEAILGNIDEVPQEKFGLILANINKNVLKMHLAGYANRMDKNSLLLLSGFFTTDTDELIHDANEVGLSLVSLMEKENWACMKLIKN